MTIALAGTAIESTTEPATEGSMRAIRYPRYGSADALELVDVDIPSPLSLIHI